MIETAFLNYWKKIDMQDTQCKKNSVFASDIHSLHSSYSITGTSSIQASKPNYFLEFDPEDL